MTSISENQTDRLLDLLAEEASLGIDPAEIAEIERLFGDAPDIDRDEIMRVASIAQVAFLKRDASAQTAMPAHLKARLADQAAGFIAARSDPAKQSADVVSINTARESRDADRGRSLSGLAGWAVAAAVALAFVVLRVDTPGTGAEPATVSAQREALLASSDVTVAEWAPSEIPAYAGVTGDVVWSDSGQQGFMRLTGLPANDPTVSQYQLWIVDANRDKHPVDGGVFDIPADGSELLIPIDAKLAVNRPAVFAITREKPGGVVVSAGPLLIVAAREG